MLLLLFFVVAAVVDDGTCGTSSWMVVLLLSLSLEVLTALATSQFDNLKKGLLVAVNVLLLLLSGFVSVSFSAAYHRYHW